MKYSKIFKVRDALLSVMDNVNHYEAVDKTEQYTVWAEDGEGSSVNSDNKKTSQTITGTIDYFTRVEDDPNIDRIQEALNTYDIAFYLNSVQLEKELEPAYIHFEWVWEV